MRVVQATALLSSIALIPSVAGIALPRVGLGQQRRFPWNDTALATASEGSTSSLSSLIQDPQTTTLSQDNALSSLSSQAPSSESLEGVTLKTSSISWSEAVSLPLTTTILGYDTTLYASARVVSLTQQPLSGARLSSTAKQLDHSLSNPSASAAAPLSATQLLSEPDSLSFSQVVSESKTLGNDTNLSSYPNSDRDREATSVDTQGTIQASIWRPHQDFVHPLTPTALSNTNSEPQICGSGSKNPCIWIPSHSATSRGNGTYTPGPWTSGTLTVTAPTSLAPCTTLQDGEPVTEYSIVYTATVTFVGNSSDYTPPYPTISTPTFCETEPAGPTLSKGPGDVGGPLPSSAAESPVKPPQRCPPDQPCSTEPITGWSDPTIFPAPELPSFRSTRLTTTFITTEKNPAVVFVTESPPHFDRPTGGGRLPMSNKQQAEPTFEPRPNRLRSSKSFNEAIPQLQPTSRDQSRGHPPYHPPSNTESGPGSGSNSNPNNDPGSEHSSQSDFDADSGFDSGSSPGRGSESGSGAKSVAFSVSIQTKTFVVTARGQEVIVNDRTFPSLKADQTMTVTVDYGTFTIRPTEVVGEGVTVKKPEPAGTIVSVISPTSATFRQIPITVSGTEVSIGVTTLKIPLMGTTMRLKIPAQSSDTVVDERKFSIAPDRIVADGETLKYHGIGAPQTDVMIVGGEGVTVVGQSVFVFRSTTLTYGPSIPDTTKTFDDDMVTIGSAGVVIGGITLGGSEAEATETKYQIVGGGTITKVNPSFAIIDETTFTAGPGANRTTKETGGETFTIGPLGITIGTITVEYPFGTSTVTTFEAKATASATLPAVTGTRTNNAKEDSKDDDDSGAAPLRFVLTTGMTGFCVALCIWILV